MTVIRYLAYGSNLLPARLDARLGDIRSLGRVALPGWGLRFHKSGADGSGKCDLVRQAGELAYGAIYEISVANRARLDRIEGVGKGYRGCDVRFAAVGELYVYLAESSHIDAGLVPFDWYHRFVLAGARHHGFPDDYVARLEAVTHARDPDDARRAENLEILERAPST